MGGFRKGGFSNSRFVFKLDVAIASEVSILSKNSLAITDFHAKKTRTFNYLKTPFPEPPHSRFPRCDHYRPNLGQKMPKMITSHDVLEPLKQVLSASRGGSLGRRPPRVNFESFLGHFNCFGVPGSLGGATDHNPKRKFSAGRPCGYPAKNFGQALQVLEKQAFWHRHATRTSTKKLRSEKLRAGFSLPIFNEKCSEDSERRFKNLGP